MTTTLNPSSEKQQDTFVAKVRRFLRYWLHYRWDQRLRRDDRDMQALFKRSLNADSCCVDIGANRGAILRQFQDLAPEGHHFAFEPIKKWADKLTEAFPDVKVFNCALSDQAGTATFFMVPDNDAWSGLQPQEYPGKSQAVEVAVELKKLDDVIGDQTRVDFIKIDVEGAELQVLRGAMNTLKRCRPTVVFEHAKIHNLNYGTNAAMVFDLLVDECGLEICNLPQTEVFSRERFLDIYESSAASGYDRNAQTNFVARPAS